jgi:sialic acid synthase SpsE/sugar phosphate isomerase/epimerase
MENTNNLINSNSTLKIGKHIIGPGLSPFVIAEIGNNHNGDFDRAKKLIDLAIECGAHCAKFQMRNLKSLYRSKSLEKKSDDLSTEYTLDLLNKFELSIEQQKSLAEYCIAKGILYMCTPWDHVSIEVLESFGVEAYKVASADLTNIPLIEKLIQTRKPLILSTGMALEEDIRFTKDILEKNNARFIFLHCNSTYPAPFKSINLKYIAELEKIHKFIGYSGHERGINVTLAAVAMGAQVVERHFTLDRNMEGPDHAASLEPDEFKKMTQGISEIILALGDGVKKISQGEMMNRENLAKSIVASKNLKSGHIITASDLDVKSPGQGLQPKYINQLIGKKLTRDMNIEDYFFSSDLTEGVIESRAYEFKLDWGVPIRYHDFDKFRAMAKADIFEFHLSYTDMDVDISKYLSGTYDCDFAVHSPELFKNSRLMDLATYDEEYRQESLKETQRVINITRELKKYFPKTKRPVIVCNIGGHTMDGNISEAEKIERYKIFEKSLSELDTDGVEIIPQTMAPFPWHFGGQRFQNLFVHADEIVSFCKKHSLRICLDVSHSKLTCNHYNVDFYEFVRKVGPYTAHLHLGDAEGVDGEGLQVGQGEIDFKKLAAAIHETCPQATFIPEIWQGHKNNGEGFWIALDKLEGLF